MWPVQVKKKWIEEEETEYVTQLIIKKDSGQQNRINQQSKRFFH